MIKAEIERSILRILGDKSSNYRDFQAKFIKIEQLCRNIHTDGHVFHYTNPYNSNISLDIYVEDGEAQIVFTENKNILKMGIENSARSLWKSGEEISQAIQRNRCVFCPAPDKDFIYEISKAQPGTVLYFGNSMSLVCTKKEDGITTFKKLFEGSLSNISLISFVNSETFTVDTKNMQDIHYLYSKAYCNRTSTAQIRTSVNSTDGQSIVTQIEASVPQNTTRIVNIGPLKLRLMKENEKCTWYDVKGQQIPKENISILFGWAKNTTYETNTVLWNNPESLYDGYEELDNDASNAYKVFVKGCLLKGNIRDVIDSAFTFSKQYGGAASLTLSGLEQDNQFNFNTATYVFMNTKTGNKIFRLTYEDGDLSLPVDNITEVSREEFEKICHQKYDTSVKLLENQNEPVIRTYLETHPEISEGRVREVIMNAAIEKVQSSGFNMYGITESDINSLSQATKELVESFYDTKDEIALSDFLQERDDIE